MNAYKNRKFDDSVIRKAIDSPRISLAEAAHDVWQALDLGTAQPLPAHGLAKSSSDAEYDLDLTCQFLDSLSAAAAQTDDIAKRKTLEEARRTAVKWLRTHFENNPSDRQGFSDHIQGSPGRDFPWDIVMPAATGLAMLYNFSPFQDTGATVASKRLREFSASVDVIACSFLHKKKADPTVEAIAEPYVASRHFLSLPPSWASWEPFKAFVVRANTFADAKISSGAHYDFIYTRAMWAPSMYAGAYFASNHPEVRWIAEFSDPLSLDVEGNSRGGPIPEDEVSTPMIKSVVAAYPELSDVKFTVFSLAEYLAFAFADEIIFTNENQLVTMLSHVQSPALVERIRSVARVSNHPTLPRSYYLREDSDYVVDDSVLNLGYFGEFYSSRSITEVTSAMRTLPPVLGKRVHLHVFTNYIPATEGNRRPRNFSKAQFDELVRRAHDGVGSHGVEDRVHFNASLPYLRFLATTEKLDYLIVNDAQSGENHEVNPYLPSKWSDYAGSSAKSWAFVEKDSILSGKPATKKTTVGDALKAREALWDMVNEKFPDLATSETVGSTHD